MHPSRVRLTQGEFLRGLGIPCGQLPVQCLPQTLVSVSPRSAPTGSLRGYHVLTLILGVCVCLNVNDIMCLVCRCKQIEHHGGNFLPSRKSPMREDPSVLAEQAAVAQGQ